RKTIGQHKLKNALGNFPKLLNDVSKRLEVYPVLGHVAQAKVLTRIIEKSTYSSAQTAVVLADESLLIPVLQTLPNELKINITMGFPLSQSPIFGLIDLWLTVQEHIFTSGTDSVDKEDVFAFLSHSLAGIPNLERERMMEAIADYQTAKVPVDLLSFSLPRANEFFKKNSTGLEALVSLEKVIAALYECRLKTEHLHLIESSLLIRIAKVLTVLNDSL